MDVMDAFSRHASLGVLPLSLALLVALGACSGDAGPVEPAARDAAAAAAVSSALVRKDIPAEDPGPPFYAKATPIQNQLFRDDGWLAVPFYRSPSCVPADFDLLELFHFPGPDGPGAFGCPLLLNGFLLIEPDAPLGTFPRQVVLEGSGSPVWFVRWDAFREAAADGDVTIVELAALEPLVGTTRSYHETLKPRAGDHTVVIDAAGTLEDGRAFSLHVTHIGDRSRAVEIRFR